MEARHERYQTRPGDPASYAAGPYTDRPTGSQAGGGLTPQDAARLSRDVASAYASLSSQFGEKFSTDLAARYEHNDDFGGELTGKLGLRYEFTRRRAARRDLQQLPRAVAGTDRLRVHLHRLQRSWPAGAGRLLSVNNPIARGLGHRT